jgi:hypothetical protein
MGNEVMGDKVIDGSARNPIAGKMVEARGLSPATMKGRSEVVETRPQAYGFVGMLAGQTIYARRVPLDAWAEQRARISCGRVGRRPGSGGLITPASSSHGH